MAERIDRGEALSAETLFALAADAFGGTLAEGAFSARDAYDAGELGLHLVLYRGLAGDVANSRAGEAMERLTEIERLVTLLPSQTRRSQEQQAFQQFSTPAPYAFACVWAAALQPTDVVLEPSAGTGALLTWPLAVARRLGLRCFANELSDRRADLLRILLEEADQDPEGALFSENAEHLHAVLPAHVRPSVVLMNPPFSQTAGRLGSRRVPQTGVEHVKQGLKRLKPYGRLVAIVSAAARRSSKAQAPFFEWLRGEPFALRADVEVSGSVYRAYGTSVETRVLVIDGVREASESCITGRAETVQELVELLAPVRALRMAEVATKPEPVGEGTVSSSGDGAADDVASLALVHLSNASSWPPKGVEPLEVFAATAEHGQDELTACIFDAYVPHAEVPGAKPHPTKLVESAAMAAAVMPPCRYRPHLPRRIVEQGLLSDAQLETVCYAGQAHGERLPSDGEAEGGASGFRQGFFLGDGTGVGKGRQVAGVLLDNVIQGRRRAVWISENRSLMRDAVRDWTALGGPADFLFDLGDEKGPIQRREGILFASYDTLKVKPRERNGKTTGIDRLEQVVTWLAGDGEEAGFDGVLIFDEAHAMSAALDTQGSRGIKKASQRALVGVELQRQLPNSRVVYASATGATEVANLAYAERLGLWGRGTPFPTVQAFVEKVAAGGIAAMELVAKDLKAMGLYLARSVSYDGVDYRTLVHDLAPHQAETYDRLAEAWQVILRGMEHALEVTRADKCGSARAAAYSQFWGAHQRFFLHVLVAMAAPSLLRDIERRLEEGRSCVVQLVSTMEAATERAYAKAVANGDDLRDLDVTPRDQLLQFVEASFPTTLYEEYEDDEGRIRSRPVKDAAGDFVECPEAVAARERLMLEVGAVSVPHGVLDQLLGHFGTDAVAEVTGRSRRFVRKTVDGVEQVVEERRTRRKCDADVEEFMAGKKRVLVFSQAGGTGRSYHADLAAENQQQRVLYCVEPGWSSARCVQGMGRVHRANQAVPPELVLVTTNLKAQRRFLSTIARRLDQLGALTKGQRQTASQGLLSSEFNLETPLSRASLHNWFVDLYRGEGAAASADVTPSLVEEQMGLRILDHEGQLNVDAIPDVPKFLNRLLSLRTDAMDAVFDSWYAYLSDALEAAREAGTLDVGVETLQAERTRKTGEEHVYTHPRTGAKTHVVTLELTRRTEITSWAEVWGRAREAQALGFFAGFAVNRRSEQVYALFRAGSRTTETGRVVDRLRRVGVRSNRLFDQSEVDRPREGGGYRPIHPDEAKQLWEAEVSAAPEFYTEDVHLVTGTILPIWDRIAGHPRIYRAQTTEASACGAEGERMIGRLIMPDHLNATLKALGAEGRRVEVTPDELAERLMAGAEAELANGWVLRRRRVAGEHRIELAGPDLAAMRELEADGVFCEIHQFRTRFFVPTGERAAGVLRAVTEHRPVVEIREGGASGGGGR
ncbi:MAG: strawberry notch-like NTP hydrolase domain-containing protein [Rhodothermales bacterium]